MNMYKSQFRWLHVALEMYAWTAGDLTSNCLVSQQVHKNETNLRPGMLNERVREKGDRQFSSLAT